VWRAIRGVEATQIVLPFASVFSVLRALPRNRGAWRPESDQYRVFSLRVALC